MSGWKNEAHVERAKALWFEGHSAAQIATMLAREFPDAAYTRNGIIGKVSRLGLPQRSIDAQRQAVRFANKARLAAAPPPKPKVVQPTGVFVLPELKGGSGLERSIAAHTANAEARANPPEEVMRVDRGFKPLPGQPPVPFGSKGCKWPVGGEGADMLCCGAKADGRIYCAAHERIAFTTPKPGAPRTANELARSLRRYVA